MCWVSIIRSYRHGVAALACLKLNNYLYPLAVAWALTASAVKQGRTRRALVFAAAFGTVTCLVAAGSVVTKFKDSKVNNGKICVSLVGRNGGPEIIENIRRAKLCHVVEVDSELSATKPILRLKPNLKSQILKYPLIATYRSPSQGGKNPLTFEI